MNIRVAVAIAATLLLVGCASASSGGGDPRPDRSVITRAELNDVDVRNLYEAIDRLRPRWLLVRGGPRSFSMETEIVVFQDQAYLGDHDVLRRMGTEGVTEIRHLDGSTASASLPGMSGRHIAGAIIVSMRAP